MAIEIFRNRFLEGDKDLVLLSIEERLGGA